MRLFLLRHAKSDWGDAGLSDHDRPLSARGRRAATAIGEWLASRSARPDLVLCSSARRTCETTERVLAGFPERPQVRIQRQLYLASAVELIRAVHATPDDVDSLMLVAHNPGIAELAYRLAGRGDPEALQELGEKYPPGALAELRFDGPGWEQVFADQGELVNFLLPRRLG